MSHYIGTPSLSWKEGAYQFLAKGGFLFIPGVKKYADRYLRGKREKKRREGPTLENVNVQTNAYGVPISQIFGTYRLAGNVIWPNRMSTDAGIPIRTEEHDGEIFYYATFAVAFCKGPIDEFTKIWFNDILVEDVTTTVPPPDTGSAVLNAFIQHFRDQTMRRKYYGTESQMPDPKIFGYEGGNDGKPIPAFRGLAYIVFENVPLAAWGNAIPNITVEVTRVFTSHAPCVPIPIEVPSDDLAQIGEAIAGDVVVDGVAENITDMDFDTSVETEEGTPYIMGPNLVDSRNYQATWPNWAIPDTEPIAFPAAAHGNAGMLNDGSVADYVRAEGDLVSIAHVGFEWDTQLPTVSVSHIRFKSPVGRTLPGMSLDIVVRFGGNPVCYNLCGPPWWIPTVVLTEGEWTTYEFHNYQGAGEPASWPVTGIWFYANSSVGGVTAVECEEMEIYFADRVGTNYEGVFWNELVTWDRVRIRIPDDVTYPVPGAMETFDGRKWVQPPHDYVGLSAGWIYFHVHSGSETSYGVRLAHHAHVPIQEFQVYNGMDPPGDGFAVPDDNLVVHADNAKVTIEDGGEWNRYDLATEQVDLTKTYRTGSTSVIPLAECDFDVDENHIIYTSKWDGQAGTWANIIKLDGDTYLETGSPSADTLYAPTRICVVRNSAAPYLYVIAYEGSELWLLDRGTLERPLWHLNWDMAPTGLSFVAMAIDDYSGTCWALAVSEDGSTSKIVCIIPFPNGETIRREYDISQYIESPDAILFGQDTADILIGSTAIDAIAFFHMGLVTMEGWDLTFTELVSGGVIPEHPKSAWRRGSVNGCLTYAHHDNVIHRLDITTRAITKTWYADPPDGDSEPPSWLGGNIYETSGDSVITGCNLRDNAYCRVYLGRGTIGIATLSDIVTDICAQAGVTAEEIDVTALTNPVWGYLLNARTRARDAIQPLMDAYDFDEVETDGILRWPKRGEAAVVVNIPETELAAHESGTERPKKLISTKQQEIELPQAVEVMFVDIAKNYEQGTQRASRELTSSRDVAAVNVPIAMYWPEARDIAERMLPDAYLKSNTHSLMLHRKYAWLDPADMILLVCDGNQYRVFIESMKYRGGMIDIEATPYKATVYGG